MKAIKVKNTVSLAEYIAATIKELRKQKKVNHENRRR